MILEGGEVSGRRLGHEGGALLNGICALNEETPGSSLTPSAMWGHGEDGHLEPGSGSLPDPGSCQCPDLELTRIQNCEKPMFAVYATQPEPTKTFWFCLCLDKILKLCFVCLFVGLFLSLLQTQSIWHPLDAGCCLWLLSSPRRTPWSGCELQTSSWTGSPTTSRSVRRCPKMFSSSFVYKLKLFLVFYGPRFIFLSVDRATNSVIIIISNIYPDSKNI